MVSCEWKIYYHVTPYSYVTPSGFLDFGLKRTGALTSLYNTATRRGF
jgi:hypothetical protein